MRGSLRLLDRVFHFLRGGYYNSSMARVLLAIPREIYLLYRYRIMSDEAVIEWDFKHVFGQRPDLKAPKTFNEKIQWLKLYDRTPLHTQCADKYAVRDYISKKVGQEILIPLLYKTEEPEDIRPENLPDPPFIIKTTHGSGCVTIVRDKASEKWEDLRELLKKQLCTNYYYRSREWQYRDIKPRIIVERLIEAEKSVLPIDYKIYCFHGKPEFILVMTGRYVETRECFYSTNWRALDFRKTHPFINSPMQRPENLEKMLEIASNLSSDFYFARIDLYHEHGQIYFGEITFHPGGGMNTFAPPEWDRKLGDMLILPQRNKLGTSEFDGQQEKSLFPPCL